jgi:hypothetical protein
MLVLFYIGVPSYKAKRDKASDAWGIRDMNANRQFAKNTRFASRECVCSCPKEKHNCQMKKGIRAGK